jgi:hypothetical protein
MQRSVAVWAACALLLASGAGCGDDDDVEPPAPDPSEEPTDKPAKPPKGWRTVGNPRAGFTMSVPRTWPARRKAQATLVRSDDHLVSVTVAADRTVDGRELPPRRFARATIRSLPGFRGRVSAGAPQVRKSPYKSARVDARGRVRTSRIPQRITAAAFQRPGRVTYIVLVFRNARVKPRFNEPVVRRMLRSLRGQPPDVTP